MKRINSSNDYVGVDGRLTGEGKGFGKLILFGEHFVVYQQPALVGAVAASTACTVELSSADVWSTGLIVEDARPAVPGYKDKKRDEMMGATQLVLKHLNVDTDKRACRITLGGDLCAVSGIGASASNCVALARALNQALSLSLTEAQINQAGYEGEKGYHGTPSGIDNTAATYGGLLRFQRRPDGQDPLFEPTPLPQPCRLVYASTGITASTTEVVGEIRERRSRDPAWYQALEDRYKQLFAQADKALRAGDYVQVAQLANQNHQLLQDLGVSCPELDRLVDAARAAGAAGAKLSGTGRGGLMWAICLDEASQKKVAKALREIVTDVWETELA